MNNSNDFDRPEEELFRRAQDGDESSREILLCRHRPLVNAMSSRFTVPVEENDDLLQAGCLGLLRAIDGFDPARGNAFSTYAVPLILGEMKKYLRDRSTVGISRRARLVVRRVRRTQSKLASELGRNPSLKEVAEELGFDPADVVLAAEAMRGVRPLSEEHASRQSAEPWPYWLDSLALGEAIEKLSARSRYLLRLRYFSDMTQQQVADKLGISQAQVSRLEKRVTNELRQLLEE